LTYSVEIRGDGSVTFEEFSKPNDVKSAQISTAAVHDLYRQFRLVKFFAFKGDCPTYSSNGTTSIAFDSYAQTVRNCPSGILDYLTDAVDRVAGIDRWAPFAPPGYHPLLPALANESDFSFLRDVLGEGEPFTDEDRCKAIDTAVLRFIFGRPMADRDEERRTALSMIMELIARGAPLQWQRVKPPFEQSTGDVCSPLRSASFYGQPELVQRLLGSGADPNWTSRVLEPALNAAAATIEVGRRDSHAGEDDYLKVGRLLIAAGADVNGRYLRLGVTPIMDAFRSAAFARLLIDAGADVNAARAYDGKTALHAVISPEVIRVLVMSGANAKAKDAKDNTALMRNISPQMLRELVAAGADVNAVNQDGETALSLSRRPELADALLQEGASPWLPSGEVHPTIKADCVEDRMHPGEYEQPSERHTRCAPILERISRGR
jgi:ankyrin repeat protein